MRKTHDIAIDSMKRFTSYKDIDGVREESSPLWRRGRVALSKELLHELSPKCV